MVLSRRFAVVVGAVAVVLASVAGTALADTVNRVLYREDAQAYFEVRDPNCPAQRTLLGVNFHQDFLREIPAPARRAVVFGVSIQQIDCQEQFVLGAEGNESVARRFDVKDRLKGVEVHTTIQACVTFPAPGGCFPVHIKLDFDGVGKTDVTPTRSHVNEPDCKLRYLDILAVRQARVDGTISYTVPGGTRQTFSLSNDDLQSAGAWLSSQYTRTKLDGTEEGCTPT
jgi:hypothetical protein